MGDILIERLDAVDRCDGGVDKLDLSEDWLRIRLSCRKSVAFSMNMRV